MKKPYQDRSDLEKIQSQWRKLTGLHTREEWSGAIVRAATGAELAANYAIREEFKKASQLTAAFVDDMLLWANGLSGKMDKLLVPLTRGKTNSQTVARLRKVAQNISKQRNMIVHQGHFMNDAEARALIEETQSFIETLVRLYDNTFVLKASSK